MDPEILKYFASLGVGGVIAGFMFLIYRQDHKQVIATSERMGLREEILIKVLQEHVKSNEILIQNVNIMIIDIRASMVQQSGDMRTLMQRIINEISQHKPPPYTP